MLFGLGGGSSLIGINAQFLLMAVLFPAKIRGPLGAAFIAANFVFSGLGSQPLLQLTFQSYIVDCVRSEERSPTFAMLGEQKIPFVGNTILTPDSSTGSATFAGLAIASVTSSMITKYTAWVALLEYV